MVKFRITQDFYGYHVYYKHDFGSHNGGYMLYHEGTNETWDSVEEYKAAAQRCFDKITQEYGLLIEEFEI